MQDNLEEFIREHKDEFDAHEPPSQVWRSVHKQLRRRHHGARRAYYAVAASVLLIIGIGGVVWFMKPAQQTNVPTNYTEAATGPGIKDTEAYYAVLIEKQRTQLDQFSKSYPEVCKDFAGEIDTLHELYGQLKVEYKNSNGNEAVMQAMIENLRTQVQLLNSQMQIILTIEQKKGKHNQHTKFT